MNRISSAARARWQALVQQQHESELSVAQFCRKHRVPASSFFSWKRRLAGAGMAPPAFVAVHSLPAEEHRPADAPQSGVELHLGPDRRVVLHREFDEPTLRRLLSVLQATPEARS